MCQAMLGSGGFDPTLCPLLQHLSPEEQQERMKSDPSIAACIGALKSPVAAGGKMGRRVKAYHAICSTVGGTVPTPQ